MKGEYTCALDDKGRLNFPARLRDELGESFVVSRWLEGCLAVFPAQKWDEAQERVEAMGLAKGRQIARFLFTGAADTVPDKQGRVRIPDHLRRFAGLEKDVVVTGNGSYAEIWDAGKWDAMNVFDNDTMAGILEEVGF